MTADGIRATPGVRNDRQVLLLSDDVTRDQMQVSGRWIEAEHPVEVRQ